MVIATSRSRRPGLWLVGAFLLASATTACAPKPVTIHIQGTVRTVGRGRPIPGAAVLIEWPASLGGGQSQVKTNDKGQFAVGRTLRRRDLICAGVAVTVQADSFATAYARHDEDDCGNAILNFSLEMLPQPR